MTIIHFLGDAIIQLNIAITLCYLLLRCVLRFNYSFNLNPLPLLLVGASLVSVLFAQQLVLPGEDFLMVSAQKINGEWGEWKRQFADSSLSLAGMQPAEMLSLIPRSKSLPFDLPLLVFSLSCMSLLIGLIFYRRTLTRLRRVEDSGMLIKKIGSVRIYASGSISTPISYWAPKRNTVIIPEDLLPDWPKAKMAISHELQHHRQRDTHCGHVVYFLKYLCFWNPFAHGFAKIIRLFQEMHCDENLLGRQKFSLTDYSNLLRHCAVAHSKPAVSPGGYLVVTELSSRALMKRRILSMFNRSSSRKRPLVKMLLGVGVAGALAIGSLSASGLKFLNAQDFDWEKAESMALRHNSNSSVNVDFNEAVFQQLQKYLGSEMAVVFTEKAKKRYSNMYAALDAGFAKHDVPRELLAIGFVESGFVNYSPSKNMYKSAGVWQIIPSTGITLGLKVTKHLDERLDIFLATQAAARYLDKLYGEFKDWRLAILAYNLGEGNLRQGIQDHGTRDPWELISHGVEGDPGYLAKVMAAMLILSEIG